MRKPLASSFPRYQSENSARNLPWSVELGEALRAQPLVLLLVHQVLIVQGLHMAETVFWRLRGVAPRPSDEALGKGFRSTFVGG
jgi:hypothetical protein